MRKLYIFDVCGTLYNVNTTFHFIREYHRNKHNFFKYVYVLFLSSIFGKLLNKFFRISVRTLIIRSLKNESVLEVDRYSHIFVCSYLQNKKNGYVFALFDTCVKNDAFNTLLASASIQPVVHAIASFYGVNYLATSLEIESGLYTGIVKHDLKGRKHEMIDDLDIDLMVSDNRDDFDLGIRAKRYIIITKQKNVCFWRTKIQNVNMGRIHIEII